MMSARPLVLHGHDVIEANANAGGAVAFEATIGAGHMPVRPPQSMRALFDRLATNEPIAMTAAERAKIEDLGIKLADATDIVRQRAAQTALAAGATPASINAASGSPAAHFKALQPIHVTKSFVPNKKTY